MSATRTRRRPSGAAADPKRVALGESIREERLRADIGLRELARRVGCSPALISKIEHGTVAPSVATLYAITRELNVPMDTLFSIDQGTARTKRRKKNAAKPYDLVRSRTGRVRLPHGIEWRRLAAGDNSVVEFREIVYDAGAMSTEPGEMLEHEGHEHGVVIEGLFMLQVGDEVLKLSPGDSIAFAAQTPHRLWNPGKAVAKAVWIIHANPGNTDSHL